MSRVEARKDFDDKTRLRLVEGDLDSFDSSVERLGDRIEASEEKLGDRMDRMNRTMLGILVAVTTASIMLAINLAVAVAS